MKMSRKMMAGIAIGMFVGHLCCAAENKGGGRLPFLWCPEDVNALTAEVFVPNGHFSVRVPRGYKNAATSLDMGSQGVIKSLVRYRIDGPTELQWFAVDHMVLKEGAKPSENIGSWVEANTLLKGKPDFAEPEGTKVETVSFGRLRPDVDKAFLAKHKAQQMSAHQGTVRVGERLCRVFVVCIGRERESWKMVVVFPLSKGIGEKDALEVTSAQYSAAGAFFGSFKIQASDARLRKPSAAYKANAEIVKRFLDDNDWRYEMKEYGNKVVFHGSISGFKGVYDSFRFAMIVDDSSVQNYAMYPASAKDKLPEMAEFLHRANYGLKYGAFEMDYSDGSVRFHFAVPISTIRADNDEILKVLFIPAQMLGKYSKGFSAVLLGIKKPVEAVSECEDD